MHTEDILEKHRGAAALQFSISHDGNAISKEVGFIHEMCGQDHCASGSLTLKNVPGLSSRLRIHSGRRLVQNYQLTTNTSLQPVFKV